MVVFRWSCVVAPDARKMTVITVSSTRPPSQFFTVHRIAHPPDIVNVQGND